MSAIVLLVCYLASWLALAAHATRSTGMARHERTTQGARAGAGASMTWSTGGSGGELGGVSGSVLECTQQARGPGELRRELRVTPHL